MKEYKMKPCDDIWSWPGSIRNKSARFPYLGMGKRLIFVYFHFSNFEVYISQNIWAKPCGFIGGIHVLLLNVTESFIILARSILM